MFAGAGYDEQVVAPVGLFSNFSDEHTAISI